MFIFLHQVVNGIGVYPYKGNLSGFVFQVLHEVAIDRIIHQQHIVSFVFCCFYQAVMFVLIVCVEHNNSIVFVGLSYFDFFLVILNGKEFSIHIFQQHKIHGFVIEFFIRQHTIFDKDTEVLPFTFIFFPLVFKQVIQFFGYFLGNVTGNFPHVTVTLQVASAHVQGDVW